MADFRLKRQVDRWFGRIGDKEPFKTKFDRYYLCVLLGLAARRESDPEDAPGFVDSFVDDYKAQQLLLVGLLLRAELVHFGIELDDRDDVRKNLGRLVGPSGLTTHGVNRLNAYASGGFDLLVQQYGDVQPFTPEEFLPRYVRILETAADEEGFWRT